MLEQEVAERLRNMHAQHILEATVPRAGQIILCVNKTGFWKLIESLKNEGFAHLSTITGLEVGGAIELLYHLTGERIILTVQVNLPLDELSMPTITDIIAGASLYEREIYDFFGVRFEGHPNLERLILPDDWPEDVYPLRKSKTEEKGEETLSS